MVMVVTVVVVQYQRDSDGCGASVCMNELNRMLSWYYLIRTYGVVAEVVFVGEELVTAGTECIVCVEVTVRSTR